jgi:methionyl aminopeptidase
MTVENQRDVDGLRAAGRVVSAVRDAMLAALEPGMTTAELDALGDELLRRHGARSAPQVTYAFPAATCISINEEAAHGVPSDRRIQPGDVVNVDVSAELDGYYADTGATRVVPPISPEKRRLCHATRQALAEAMKEVRAGNRINRLGRAVERVARAHRFRIIRNLAGHGVGRALHENPEEIVSYYRPGDRRVLREGMVLAVEPFLSTRATAAYEADDGWTLCTAPGNFSAQYEHTLIVTRGRPIVVTTPHA